MDDEATFNCPHCGTLYTVSVRQHLAVESANARCSQTLLTPHGNG